MAISLRGSYQNNNGKTVASVSVVAGDYIIVGYSSSNYYSASVAASDGTDTYLAGGYVESSNAAVSLYLFYTKATTTGTRTITITDSTSSSPGMVVHVVSGLLSTQASVLDAFSSLSDASSVTSHTGSNATASTVSSYIFSFWNNHYNGGTITENGQSFTIRQSNYTNQYMASLDRIVSSTGTYHDAITSSVTTYEANITGIFKGDVAGPAYDPSKMLACF